MNKFFQLIFHKIRQSSLIMKYPTIKELLKYSLVGNISNLIDIGLYIYLTRVFVFWQDHYLSANAVTMFIASIIRFLFHKHWTFRDTSRNTRTQYLKFIIVLVIGLIVNELVLFVAVEHFQINDLFGKLIGLGIGTIIVYTLTKKWVFDKGELTKKINKINN